MFLLEELRRGASGTMTGFAFTEILVAVFEAWSTGEQQRAERVFDEYVPLIRFENQPVINLSYPQGVVAPARRNRVRQSAAAFRAHRCRHAGRNRLDLRTRRHQ